MDTLACIWHMYIRMHGSWVDEGTTSLLPIDVSDKEKLQAALSDSS